MDAPKTVAIDVMEYHIERPKNQEDYYSGKKKCHTVKSQIIADVKTRLIYDVEETRAVCTTLRCVKGTSKNTKTLSFRRKPESRRAI